MCVYIYMCVDSDLEKQNQSKEAAMTTAHVQYW